MAWLTVVLPFPSPSQNQTDRWHWARKARLRDQVQMLVRVAMRRHGIPPGYKEARPMRLHVVRCGKRQLDFGNLVGGFKVCLDALVREGALHDDSAVWVHDHYSQQPPGKGSLKGSTIIRLDPQ